MTTRALVASILLFLTFLAWITPACAAVVFFAGSETGDTGEFSTFTGVPTAVTSPIKHGNYAYSMAGPGVRAMTPTGLNCGATCFIRFYWQADTTAGFFNDNYVYIGSPTSGNSFILAIATVDKKFFFCFSTTIIACTHIATGTTVFNTGQWYLVEVKTVVHASTGGMEVKVDGGVEFSSFATNTSAPGNTDKMSFGPVGGGGERWYYDDIIAGTDAYFGAGINIARQGLSGTPTYNAWTKAGTCSGGNISTCWSTTPFSTAASATSIVASDAQTMLVSGFGTTQSGHGTETIAAHDTINACKTALIAKTAVASGISIRRRINGSDTDTAKTLTTSDAYYDDGIWTTTADILRTSTNEIGAIHGTGVNLDTVEDAWLICDYLAVAAPIRHRVTQ